MPATEADIIAKCNALCKNTLMETLQIEFVSADPSTAELTAKMPVTPRVHQPDGILHGGATAALAESVGSAAAFLHFREKKVTIRGLEITANHLKPVKDGYIFATATALHAGRTTQLWQVRITDESSRLVSLAKLSTITL